MERPQQRRVIVREMFSPYSMGFWLVIMVWLFMAGYVVADMGAGNPMLVCLEKFSYATCEATLK